MPWKNCLLTTSIACLLCCTVALAADPAPVIQIRTTEEQVEFVLDKVSLATYVFADPRIARPYFKDVRTRTGIQVTRNYPPVEGVDRTDHDTMHPGIWLAFGNLGGEDFWRNHGRVEHVKFITQPQFATGEAMFQEEKRYLTRSGSEICREKFQCRLITTREDYFLLLRSQFYSDSPFSFGDQEEMGLGLRVATPLSEVAGGKMLDSEGRSGAGSIWSQSADWCAAEGEIEDINAGIMLMCHPQNFRPSWFHARNYGLIAANPFGRKALNKGEISEVAVAPGTRFVLHYGIHVHARDKSADADRPAAFREYVRFSQQDWK